MLNNDKDKTPRKRHDLCGLHVQQLRLAHGLSLEDLQAALEQRYKLFFPTEELARIESGSVVYAHEMVVFADFFQVSCEYLVWGKDNPSKENIREILKTLELPRARRSLRRGRLHHKKLLTSPDKNARR